MKLFHKSSFKTGILAIAFAFCFGAAANANVIKTFNLSGSFDNGATLSGTLNIDVTAGLGVGAHIIVSAPTAFITDTVLGDIVYHSVNAIAIKTGIGPVDKLYINLPGLSLIDYAGGPIISLSMQACNSADCLVTGFPDGQNLVYLQEGKLTFAPEPLTMALFGAGLFGMAAIRRSRAFS